MSQPARFLQTCAITLRHKPIKTHCYGREQDSTEHRAVSGTLFRIRTVQQDRKGLQEGWNEGDLLCPFVVLCTHG